MKIILLGLLASLSAFAQWGGQVTLEHNISKSGGESNGFQEIGFYTKYKFPKNGQLILRLEGILQDDDFGIRDGRLRFTNNIHDQGAFSFNSDLRIGLGFSELSREISPLLTFLRWAPSVTANLSKPVDKTTFTFTYKPYLKRLIYDKDVDITNFANGGIIQQQFKLKHEIMHLFNVGVGFLEKFSLNFGYAYYMQWNTNGNRVDDQNEFYQELSYQIDEQFSLFFGHYNNGLAFDKDGGANRLALTGGGEFYAFNLNMAFDL